MKGCTPAALLEGLIRNQFRTTQHFLRGSTSECQQENALGCDAIQKQMCDTVRERIGLAGARACDDQKRTRFHAAPRGSSEGCGLQLGSIQTLTERGSRVDLGIHRPMMSGTVYKDSRLAAGCGAVGQLGCWPEKT
jgi:hypothetical protein